MASCQGLSLGGDPRTPRPRPSALLFRPTPLNPDPERLQPRSTVSPNVRWAWQEASGAPQKEGREQRSREETKVVYAMSGCLDGRVE